METEGGKCDLRRIHGPRSIEDVTREARRREMNRRGEMRRNEKYQRAVNTKVNISIKDTENTSDRN